MHDMGEMNERTTENRKTKHGEEHIQLTNTVMVLRNKNDAKNILISYSMKKISANVYFLYINQGEIWGDAQFRNA